MTELRWLAKRAALALLALLPAVAWADPLDVWHPRGALSPGDVLMAVAHGGGRFVAVGEDGLIISSPDGQAWTREDSGCRRHLKGIAFGNHTFVAVGEEIILVSYDGRRWESRGLEPGHDLHDVVYAQGLFVAVGMGPLLTLGGVVFTSPDGDVWTLRDPGAPACVLEGVAFGSDRFVSVGHYLIDADYVIRCSSDGLNWGGEIWGARQILRGVDHDRGLYVAAGWDMVTDAGVILTSRDGDAWSPAAPGPCKMLYKIAHGRGVFVVVGEEGAILTSGDGVAWTARNAGLDSVLMGIAFGDETFVAVGNNGVILQSDPFPEPDNGLDKRCFIATAAYDGVGASEVAVLRSFRDRRLMPYELGRSLVSAYYSLSPIFAEGLRKTPALKPLVRWLLAPLVSLGRAL